MRTVSAMLACLVLLAQHVEAPEGRDVDVKLPRTLKAGETAFVEVKLSVIGRGKEIEVTTASGRELGVISPFGVRTGQEAGTYTLPVPSDVFVNGHVTIRLSLNQVGHTQRAPTTNEVKSVRVKIAPAAR